MRITELLFGWRDAAPAPSRMIGFPLEGGLLPSGVTPLTALGISAVWRSVDILSNGVSQLPWREMRGNLELSPSRLVRAPLGMGTRREWTSYVTSTLALFDICYLLKVGGTDAEGVPMGLLPLEPGQVMPKSVTQSISPFIPPESYYVGQSEVPADSLVILRRSPLPGATETTMGVVRMARATFAAAIAAENYASRFWQAGGAPTTVLETDAPLNDAIATGISDKWRERRAMGPDYAPVLDRGLKARMFGADPTTESAVEARKELVADIGRYFGIGTTLLNAPAGDSETYGTTESQGIHLVNFTLNNYIGAIEDAVSDQLPGGRRLEMDPGILTRGTQLAQAQALQMLTGGKTVMSVDEARETIKLPPQESPDMLNPAVPEPVPGGMPDGRQEDR